MAGKRAGMLHEANGDAETTRSGLFYDQIRIIKEMREAHVQESGGSDQLVRGVRHPRYSIWENVPGALSAGKEKGEAFQAVLTEFVRIVEPDAPPVPMPDKGKWPTAGCLYDPMGRWSVAWRVHDLQFWGCPQRRKRLCVLCDFDGATAPWLLFDPEFRGEAEDTPPVEAESDPRTEPRSEVQPLGEGLRGNPQSSQSPRQGVAEGTESSTRVASTITATYGTKWNGNAGAYSGGNFVIEEPESYTLKVRGGIEVDSHGRKAGKGPLVQTELSGTLGVSQDQTLIQPCLNPNDPQSKRVFDPDGIAPTLNSGTSEGKNIVPSVCLNPWDVQSKHIQSPDGIAEALYSGECRYGGGVMNITEDMTNALRAQMKHHEPIVYDGSNVTCPTNASNPHRGDPSHTLTADDRNYLVYENHSQDTRYKELGNICQTVSATYGMGGNNQPLVLESNQNHATVTDSGVVNTLPSAMGMGGGYVPMVVDEDQRAKAYGISAYDSNAMKSSNPHSGVYEADTSRTLDLNGGSPACNQGGVAIVEPVPIEGNGQRESHRGDGYGESGDPMFTLNSTEHHAVAESYQDTTESLMASGYDKLGTQEAMNDRYVVGKNWDGSETSPTLTKNNAGGNQRMPDKDNFNAVLQEGVECMQNGWYQATGDMSPSLLARDYKDPPVVKKPKSVVRRLTPKECERLQGFPDDWTDLGEWTDSKGKKHKEADSPRYKALGNSIGLPFWQDLAARIAAQYDRPATLGSLFDGIGGFPLVFERCGGKAVWASEIEEFPIAVTKKHFPEEE